jgi:two-component system NtrC family sensor kinase
MHAYRDSDGCGGSAAAALPLREGSRSDAERRAERKLRLTGELIKFAGVSLLLLVFLRPIGFLVFLVWGLKLAPRVYRVWLEPELRERFVEGEVEKQVAESLLCERRVLEGEHARSLERLSASIAHEIRNPITAAKSLVQQMEEDPGASENVEYARVALAELERVERSVSHLLRFARDEELRFGELRLADVVDSALETFRDRLARSGIALERRLDCAGALRGDAEKLRRVAINLVANAVEALEHAGTKEPRIAVEVGENLAGSQVWLRVSDNGPGLSPAARDRLFSPFYTSKQEGTGLGLALSQKLVEGHGGSIEVESRPGAGAAFLVTLPKAPPAPRAGRP